MLVLVQKWYFQGTYISSGTFAIIPYKILCPLLLFYSNNLYWNIDRWNFSCVIYILKYLGRFSAIHQPFSLGQSSKVNVIVPEVKYNLIIYDCVLYCESE